MTKSEQGKYEPVLVKFVFNAGDDPVVKGGYAEPGRKYREFFGQFAEVQAQAYGLNIQDLGVFVGKKQVSLDDVCRKNDFNKCAMIIARAPDGVRQEVAAASQPNFVNNRGRRISKRRNRRYCARGENGSFMK